MVLARIGMGFLGVVLLAANFTACSGSSEENDLAALRALVAVAGDIDYEPLRSPAEAVQASDLVVLGEVVGARLATQATDAAADRETRYVILTVAVRTVLAGVLPEPAGTVVYVALRAAGIDPAREIEEVVPKVRALLVLDDRSDTASPGDSGDLPERFYEPFTDGAWFEVDDSFEGLWADRSELEERWGQAINSLDDLAELIRVAADQ
jgi:hypothetical protein